MVFAALAWRRGNLYTFIQTHLGAVHHSYSPKHFGIPSNCTWTIDVRDEENVMGFFPQPTVFLPVPACQPVIFLVQIFFWHPRLFYSKGKIHFTSWDNVKIVANIWNQLIPVIVEIVDTSYNQAKKLQYMPQIAFKQVQMILQSESAIWRHVFNQTFICLLYCRTSSGFKKPEFETDPTQIKYHLNPQAFYITVHKLWAERIH